MSSRQAFAAFVSADEVDSILKAFAEVQQTLNINLSEELCIEKFCAAAADSDLPFSHKKLLSQLQERRTRCSKGPYGGTKFVISGAGPCGLRAAVESRMIGFDVTVVEKRYSFSRHNIVKTWKETIADLLAFGLQAFIPGFKPHGHCHLGIRQMQIVLFKAALLYGVKFHYQMRTIGVLREDDATMWSLCAVPAAEPVHHDHLSLKPTRTNFEAETIQKTSKVDFFERAETEDGAILSTKPDSPGLIMLQFDSLFIAEGESSSMLRNLGFDRKLVKYAQAIGVVVNLKLRGEGQSSSLYRAPEAFLVSKSEAEWRSGPLGVLAGQEVDVENMEYMTGTDSHFIVVTAKKGSLLSFGVIKDDFQSAEDLLKHENVDADRLREFGRSLANAAGLPADLPFADFHPIQIFDFSTKGRCTTFVKQLPDCAGPSGLVFPIGDAVQNPFWPQGLGVNRGFHSSLDAVWSAQQSSLEDVMKERGAAWAVLDWKAFAQTSVTPAAKWNSDPTTRYHRNLYLSIHMDEVSRHVSSDASVLTARCRAALGLK